MKTIPDHYRIRKQWGSSGECGYMAFWYHPEKRVAHKTWPWSQPVEKWTPLYCGKCFTAEEARQYIERDMAKEEGERAGVSIIDPNRVHPGQPEPTP